VNTEWRKRAFEGFERATELPMLALSLAIIPLLVVPWVVDLPKTLNTTFVVVDWSIWAAFALELAIKTYLVERRGDYLVRHWFDVVIVAVPFLRPLRVVRSARALRLLRLTRVGAFGVRGAVTLRTLMGRHGLQYSLLIGLVLFLASAGAVTWLERDSGGPIGDFGTALWWAVSTVTTVGYGDAYPITPEGKGVAAFLMLVGIVLFSVVTANVAALLVESEMKEEDTTMADLVTEMRHLREELAALRAEGSGLRAAGSSESTA
jgi:voltage-gated potassium channel